MKQREMEAGSKPSFLEDPVQESLRQTPVTPCKLIILYMLNSTSCALNTARISDFILDGDYANFRTLQIAVSELTKEGLVAAGRENNRTYLSILPEGREALEYYRDRLLEDTRIRIRRYLEENAMELRNEASIRTRTRKAPGGGYEAELSIKEGRSDLLTVTIHAPTEEMAYSVCEKWKEKHGGIYRYLVKELY